jgi:nucleotide-binding universal stress UspA family protein
MFHHLLVPLDGSKLAEAVLPAVSFLADKAHCSVTLIHVIEKNAPSSVHGQSHLTKAADAEEYLRVIAGKLPDGVEVHRHVHDSANVSDLAASLSEHAGEFGPDLIVMCEHGEDALRDWLFGSMAQRVVNRDSTPVLLLQPASGDKCPLPCSRVLVPLDLKPEHEVAIDPASQLAALCGSRLDLLTVVPRIGSLSGTAAPAGGLLPGATMAALDMEEEHAAEYLSAKANLLAQSGLAVGSAVDRGDAVERITAYARDRQIDLIALGTHGKTGTQAFWEGSLAARLIRGLRISYLLAPVPVEQRAGEPIPVSPR